MLRPGRRHLPVLAIVAAVLVANGPYLVGPFHSSPSLLYSGMSVHTGGSLLAGNPSIDPTDGFQAQALGRRAALELLHLRLPWWNQYEGLGMPLAGNMQSAALFPLVFLELWPWGLLASHVVLEAAAGIATYLLLRRLSVSTAPATAAGCAFALNGTFSWFAHAPVNVVATLPMALLGIEMARHAARAARTGGWILVALALALAVYAGFPETAFIDGLLMVVWTAARLPGLTRSAAARFGAKLGVGALIAGLLAAPLLVAFLDDLRGADVGGHGGALATASVPAAGAAQWAMPYFLGPIFGYVQHGQPADLYAVWGNTGGYVSLVVVALALVGTAGAGGGRYRLLRVGLGGWAVVCSARIFGAGWAITLLNLIPGVDRTAFYRYCPPAVELALVVLAALGLEDLAARSRRQRAGWLAGAAAASGVVIMVVAGQADTVTGHGSTAVAGLLGPWRQASLGWALFGLAAILAAALLAARRVVVTLSALVAADAVLLFAVPEFSAPRHGSIDVAAVAYLRQHVGLQRVYAMDGSLQPNYGSYFGVAEIDSNDAPVPGPWARYITERLDTNADPINFTGSTRRSPTGPSAEASLLDRLDSYRAAAVRYVIAPPDLLLPRPLVRVWSDAQTVVYEIPGAAPLFQARGGPCRLRATGGATVRVGCSHPAVLIRRVLDEPGWRATTGGRDAPIAAFGGAFQAVHLPAGATTVRFSFRPPHLAAAEAAWACGWALVAASVLARTGSRSRFRLRRPRAPADAGTAGPSAWPATSCRLWFWTPRPVQPERPSPAPGSDGGAT